MRLVLITGNQLRHRWLAWTLQAARPRWAIATYQDGARPTPVDQLTVEMRLLEPPYHAPPVPSAWPGQPDLVLLYGCHLVDTRQFTCPVLNLHMGLSPYYRGSGTNVWALHDGKPECVGATIHLATDVVDGGPILHQVRPVLQPEDGIHECGTRTLKAAVKVLPDVLGVWRYAGTRQDLSKGTVYKRKDYTEAVKAQAEQLLADGLIRDYLAHKAERDAAYPIVEG